MQALVRNSRKRKAGEMVADGNDDVTLKPGRVLGHRRSGMVFQSEFDVYSQQEFLDEHKTAHTTLAVPTIKERNEDGILETLCLVRAKKRRRLILFSESAQTLEELLLAREIRPGQAIDYHTSNVKADVNSRERCLQAADRLSVLTVGELRAQADDLEVQRLLQESLEAAAKTGSEWV
jgi:hypothetical protein